jgi:hypothetical protein
VWISSRAVQCYGGNGGGKGNLSLWPEYEAPVGQPAEEPSKNASTGVWSRRYSHALAIVNPMPSAQPFHLPAGAWRTLYGDDVPAAQPSVQLPPASGLVLLSV